MLPNISLTFNFLECHKNHLFLKTSFLCKTMAEKHMSLFCFIYWYYSLNSNCVTDCESNIFLFKSNKIKYQRKNGSTKRKTSSEVFVLEILIAFVILFFSDVVSCHTSVVCLEAIDIKKAKEFWLLRNHFEKTDETLFYLHFYLFNIERRPFLLNLNSLNWTLISISLSYVLVHL